MTGRATATRPMRTRRLRRCPDCALPVSLCLCAELPRIRVRTRVILVMHYLEGLKPTNTGRLAGRVLEGAQVHFRGEVPPLPEGGAPLLLFPLPGARVLSAADAADGALRLIVPDGTWKQARRICYREEIARGVAPVTLPPGPPGRYGGLRRTNLEGALCTFEAVARALGILEGEAVQEQMMQVLDEFVRRSLITRSGRVQDPVATPG